METPAGAGAVPVAATTATADGPTRPDVDDRELIELVRRGHTEAYGTLYTRHLADVQRLAGRLTRDRHERDDVVSEVFAATMRAIRRGRGPTDDMRPYVLRATRHQVAKLRSRTDTAHAIPTEPGDLDLPGHADDNHLAGSVEQALVELPERYQNVLWLTCVEGRTPSDAATDLDPGAAASLTHRARRALARSYLRVETGRPTTSTACRRLRRDLPAYVQSDVAAGTALRIEEHLAGCTECAAVCAEMIDINSRLRTMTLPILVLVTLRHWFAGLPNAIQGSAVAAPVVLVASVGLGGAEPSGRHETVAAAASVVAPPVAPQTIDNTTIAFTDPTFAPPVDRPTTAATPPRPAEPVDPYADGGPPNVVPAAPPVIPDPVAPPPSAGATEPTTPPPDDDATHEAAAVTPTTPPPTPAPTVTAAPPGQDADGSLPVLGTPVDDTAALLGDLAGDAGDATRSAVGGVLAGDLLGGLADAVDELPDAGELIGAATNVVTPPVSAVPGGDQIVAAVEPIVEPVVDAVDDVADDLGAGLSDSLDHLDSELDGLLGGADDSPGLLGALAGP